MPPGDSGLRQGPQPRNRRIWNAKTDGYPVRPTTQPDRAAKGDSSGVRLVFALRSSRLTLIRYLRCRWLSPVLHVDDESVVGAINDPINLQLLCSMHHADKTAHEAQLLAADDAMPDEISNPDLPDSYRAECPYRRYRARVSRSPVRRGVAINTAPGHPTRCATTANVVWLDADQRLGNGQYGQGLCYQSHRNRSPDDGLESHPGSGHRPRGQWCHQGQFPHESGGRR